MRFVVAGCTIMLFFTLAVSPEAVGPAENTPATDFVELAGKAFPADGGMNREYGDQLWAAAYKLPQWYFLMTPKSMKNKMPSAQMIDGKDWYLVFTDSDKLQAYAKMNNNLDAKGNALFMTMTPTMAVEFARKNADGPVFGVRFNEGQAHGWFSPMRNLAIFPGYLKKKGLL